MTGSNGETTATGGHSGLYDCMGTSPLPGPRLVSDTEGSESIVLRGFAGVENSQSPQQVVVQKPPSSANIVRSSTKSSMLEGARSPTLGSKTWVLAAIQRSRIADQRSDVGIKENVA